MQFGFVKRAKVSQKTKLTSFLSSNNKNASPSPELLFHSNSLLDLLLLVLRNDEDQRTDLKSVESILRVSSQEIRVQEVFQSWFQAAEEGGEVKANGATLVDGR